MKEKRRRFSGCLRRLGSNRSKLVILIMRGYFGIQRGVGMHQRARNYILSNGNHDNGSIYRICIYNASGRRFTLLAM